MGPASLLAPGGDREAATDLSTANEAGAADPVPARLYPNTESRRLDRVAARREAAAPTSTIGRRSLAPKVTVSSQQGACLRGVSVSPRSSAV
jgi:hypothetical protein